MKTLTLTTALLMASCGHVFASRPTSSNATAFPQTTALRQDLARAQRDLLSLARRLDRTRSKVRGVRKQVQLASSLVRLIDSMDNRLPRIIRELKSLSRIPQLRVLRPLVRNLEQIRQQVHKVRARADKVNREVLKPLAARLKTIERDIAVTAAQCRVSASKANVAARGVAFAQQVVQQRGSRPREVAGLERASRTARGGIRPLVIGIANVNRAAANVERNARSLATSLKSLTALRPGIAKLNRDLSPADKAAGALRKVMSQRVSVKVFGKRIGFTVRQVLEGPGKVADFILKPLMKLADKAIAGAMKGLKLQIRAPREVRLLEMRLNGVANSAARFTTSLRKTGTALKAGFLVSFQKSIAGLPTGQGR